MKDFSQARNELAQNSLDYALETILREAASGRPHNKDKEPASKETAGKDRKDEQSASSSQAPASREVSSGENSPHSLDDALDSLLKDAEEKAQSARLEGGFSRSFGADPAAERRQALQEAARRRAELEEGGAAIASKPSVFERISPRTARILMVLPLVFVVCFFLYGIFVWPVKASVTIEAGDAMPEATAYAWFSWQQVRFASESEKASYLQAHQQVLDQVDTSLPGCYNVFLRFGFITYRRSLIVADSTPPAITGETEKTAQIGVPFSYRQGINVTDNSSAEVILSVDAQEVDLQTPGDYPVTYTATDGTGNVSSVSGTVHVIPAKEPERTAAEEEVFRLSEAVLQEIIIDHQTYEQKARAVFDWVQKNITFRESNQGADNFTANALQGLQTGNGDCHVFAAVSEALLSGAGIPNMRIENRPGEAVHEWNLINLGEGWHHFDALISQGVREGKLFNLTNAELEKEATQKGYVHRFDETLYPPIE